MTHASSESTPIENRPSGHEPDKVSVRVMACIGPGLLLLVVFVQAGVGLTFTSLGLNTPDMNADVEARSQLMIPGVEPNQEYDRQRISATERAALNHYGWQDKENGMVRIPVERAIELMAARQLEVTWPNSAAGTSAKPASNSTSAPLKKEPM